MYCLPWEFVCVDDRAVAKTLSSPPPFLWSARSHTEDVRVLYMVILCQAVSHLQVMSVVCHKVQHAALCVY